MTKHKYPIIINADSYQGGNRFRYTFPLGAVSLNKAKIALQNIQIYYSWFNVGPTYNNKIFTLLNFFNSKSKYINKESNSKDINNGIDFDDIYPDIGVEVHNTESVFN